MMTDIEFYWQYSIDDENWYDAILAPDTHNALEALYLACFAGDDTRIKLMIRNSWITYRRILRI